MEPAALASAIASAEDALAAHLATRPTAATAKAWRKRFNILDAEAARLRALRPGSRRDLSRLADEDGEEDAEA